MLGWLAVPRALHAADTVTTFPEISPRPGVTVPPSLPSGFPVYPNATLVDGREQTGGQVIVIWRSPDSSSSIYDFYKTQLNEGEWRVTQAVDLGPYVSVQFARRGQLFGLGQVVVQRATGGGSMIVVQIIPSPLGGGQKPDRHAVGLPP